MNKKSLNKISLKLVGLTKISLSKLGRSLVEFALILNGKPTAYAEYTRVGVGWSSDIDSTPIANAENDPMYEYDGGVNQYSSYAGTNLVPNSVDPSSWGLSGGATYTQSTGIFSIPSGGFVRPLRVLSSIYQGKNYTDKAEIEVISGLGLLRIFDGVGLTDKAITETCECEVSQLFDAASTRNEMYIRSDGSGTAFVCRVYNPQVNEGRYSLPYIPTTGTAVTVNQPNAKISSLEKKPWMSTLGTPYGLLGLLNGVDGNPAIGTIKFKDFQTASIAADIDLIRNDAGTRILWIEATTGLIKATDGVNTAVSNAGITIDTPYDFHLACNADELWITIAGSKGVVSVFSGSFPAIGDYLKYTDSGVYHTVDSVSFDSELLFEYVYHQGELVLHEGQPVVRYL